MRYTSTQIKIKKNKKNYGSTNLLCTAGQHADDAEADGLDGQGGGPILRQDGQTYMAVAVHVGMHGNVGPQKNHLKKKMNKVKKQVIKSTNTSMHRTVWA
jgi:hypothetical protein